MVQTLLQALGIDRVTDTATTYCSSQGRGKVSPLQLIKKKVNLYFRCMGVCLHRYMCTVCARCWWKPEESTRYSETGITDDC